MQTKRRNPFGDVDDARDESSKAARADETYERTLKMLFSGNPSRIQAPPPAERTASPAAMAAAGRDGTPAFGAKSAPATPLACPSCRTRCADDAGGPALARPSACSFCSQALCTACERECDGCLEVFCSCCAVDNYELHNDRVFCLSCANDSKRTSSRSPPRTCASPFTSSSLLLSPVAKAGPAAGATGRRHCFMTIVDADEDVDMDE